MVGEWPGMLSSYLSALTGYGFVSFLEVFNIDKKVYVMQTSRVISQIVCIVCIELIKTSFYLAEQTTDE